MVVSIAPCYTIHSGFFVRRSVEDSLAEFYIGMLSWKWTVLQIRVVSIVDVYSRHSLPLPF